MLKSPFHPGYFLRQLLHEHSIAQTRLARHLHVQIGVMAIKLGSALRTTPEFWLNLQTAYDLGRAKNDRPIKPIVRVA
jgi:plasmid maintenance system antidote protein VapI